MNIDTLKKHYPSCSRIFDQILATKSSEEEYKIKYAKELADAKKETNH